MGLETSTTITGMNANWPLGTDPRSEGDNHLRLVKSVLQAVFADTATRLDIKKVGIGFFKTTTMQVVYTDGTTVRALVYANIGADAARLSLQARDSAGVTKNTSYIDENGLTIGGAGVLTGLVDASGKAGASKFREVEIDPTAAVTGARILPSDTNSGRLFFEPSTGVAWSVAAWDSTGYLLFSSGGTYGSATGTARVGLWPNGDMSVSRYMRTNRLSIETSPLVTPAVPLAQFWGSTTTALISNMDAAGVETGRLEISNAVMNKRALSTDPASQEFRLSNLANVSRLQFYYNTSTQDWARMQGRNDAGDFMGAMRITGTKGSQYCEFATTSSEGEAGVFITTGNLERTVYAGSTAAQVVFPIGTTVPVLTRASTLMNAVIVPCLQTSSPANFYIAQGQPEAGTVLTGTWRSRGRTDADAHVYLAQRVA